MKKTTAIVIAALVVSSALLIAGCGQPSLVGTYTIGGHPDAAISVTPDGKFVISENGKTLEGFWRQSGNKVTLTVRYPPGKPPLIVTINGSSITDSEQQQWVKETK